jgi:predicted CoA-binding protein
MSKMPADVAAFLSGKRIAVAGVSRNPPHPANAIFRKLVTAGYEVIPINPHTSELEGTVCYADVTRIPGKVDGVVINTPGAVSLTVLRQCAEKGVKHVWLHRSLGDSAVSDAVIKEGQKLGLAVVSEGCPLMYVQPIDTGHKCIRWWLDTFGREVA